MHYELYLDSMFLLNLGMNLLLLIMVDHSTCRTATWYRLLAGAGVGAVWYLFPFLWKGTAALYAARNIVDAYSNIPNPELAFAMELF